MFALREGVRGTALTLLDAFSLAPSQDSPSHFCTQGIAWPKKMVQVKELTGVHHSCKRRFQAAHEEGAWYTLV